MNKQYIQWPKSTIIKIKFSREWTDLTTLVPKIKRCHLNSVHAQHFLKMPKCQWREIHLRIKLGTTKEQLSVAHRPTSLAQSFPSLPDLTQWIIMLTQELFAQWCRRPLTDESENMKRVCIIANTELYKKTYLMTSPQHKKLFIVPLWERHKATHTHQKCDKTTPSWNAPDVVNTVVKSQDLMISQHTREKVYYLRPFIILI